MDTIDGEVEGTGQGPELLVTVEEAARRLSLGRTTIYALIARGRLRTVTSDGPVGSRSRISPATSTASAQRARRPSRGLRLEGML